MAERQPDLKKRVVELEAWKCEALTHVELMEKWGQRLLERLEASQEKLGTREEELEAERKRRRLAEEELGLQRQQTNHWFAKATKQKQLEGLEDGSDSEQG